MVSSDVESPRLGSPATTGVHTTDYAYKASRQNASGGEALLDGRERDSSPEQYRQHHGPSAATTTGRDSLEEGDGASSLNEHSPLLSPGPDSERDQEGVEHDDSQQTKSLWYLILLTISIGGLQIAWSVELSNGSPYLLSLGLSKSLMALVWIAGPLTGTLVQPYVGMLSDNCRISWGKRKPFMLGGALATIISLMFLAWTKEIVRGFLGIFGADPESGGVRTTVICVAVVGVYVLDFAINTVQAAIRAFIVDCAPAHQQEAANAMASRITGIGNIVGYCAGYIDLPKYLWFLGDSQFKVLCVIASLALGTTVVLSTTVIKERDPRLDDRPQSAGSSGSSKRSRRPGVLAFFATIFKSIRRLPPQIKKVCLVQFCAWVGFFPLLFYTSSYIGEIYVEPFLQENPNLSPEELDRLYEQATRVGTFALLINSIVSLLTNLFLPFFIAPTYDSVPIGHDNSLPAKNYGDGNSDDEHMYDTEHTHWLDRLRIPGFTLKRAWFASLILFAVAMFCTVLVRTVAAATALIGIVGITWAMTLWAPWAIISAEISRRDAYLRAARRRRAQHKRQPQQKWSPSRPGSIHDDNNDGAGEGSSSDVRMGSAGLESASGSDHAAGAVSGQGNGQGHGTKSAAGQGFDSASSRHDQEEDETEEEVDQAGVILGIHNMAIAAPQIIATVGSSIIFRIWQKPRGTPGDHSIAIVLALGGIAVLISSFFVAAIRESASAPADGMVVAEEGGADAITNTAIPFLDGSEERGGSSPGGEAADGRRGTRRRPGIASSGGSRRTSYEGMPRVSIQRATLTRNKSFGGMEY